MMRFVFITKAKVKLYLGATYSPKVNGPKHGQEGSGKSGAHIKSEDVHKLFIHSITHVCWANTRVHTVPALGKQRNKEIS